VAAVAELSIETVGLRKRYGDVEALRGLDLEVPRGSVFGFLGPNGSGKTTAMRILLGLARPSAGQARVFGADVVADSLDIRRRTGYLAQLPRFDDTLTPRETLRFSLGFFPRDPDVAVEEQIAEAIELVGLGDASDRTVGTLSGGQRQRLGIAQACVHRPDLLVLDEPAAALDPIGRRDVLDIMRRLRGRTTVFYSTHILDDVQRISDIVAVLHRGERVTQAPTEVLLAGDGRPSFSIELRGEVDDVVRRLEAQPWIGGVTARSDGSGVRLHVTADDAAVAEQQLLRLVLADEGVVVTGFARHRFELEEVFVDLVAGATP
jgi:ABC-2 type transport system ATP-binding protein